jgi:hypothetical protein
MIKLKSSTGKVHIGIGDTNRGGVLCNSYLGPSVFYNFFTTNKLIRTDEKVTCKSCLKILNSNNPNRKESLVIAESFMSDSEEPIKVKVRFGSRVNSITTFFDTKAEKGAYIRGVKDAQSWHHIEIDGESI